MFETEITQNRFLLGYCQNLVIDLPDERLTEQPLPNVNHPAWILGHLTNTFDVVTGMLGGEKKLDAAWNEKFGRMSKGTAVRSDYPSKEELLAKLLERAQAFHVMASGMSEEKLNEPNPNPRMKDAMPRTEDLVAFLMTGHFATHLGQLSAWRRMIGLPPLF
jgi:uncharacterized damage-inducible protein DinB